MKAGKRQLKKLARLYAASLINLAEVPADDMVELEPYLKEIARDLLKKSGQTEFCTSFAECAKKTVTPFKFK